MLINGLISTFIDAALKHTAAFSFVAATFTRLTLRRVLLPLMAVMPL